jgi:DNA-directed RNA polymerase subunit RPC12/RpoP
MVKILDGIKNVGEEIQCKECDSVIHFEYEDLFDVEYFLHGTKRKNQGIDCPKCGCLVLIWSDR